MTDKQKGLIPTVQEIFPDLEHRFCVRHLYQNFQGSFKGENLKNQLWACARSITVTKFNTNMEMMKSLDPKAHAWLEQMMKSLEDYRRSSEEDQDSKVLVNKIKETSFVNVDMAHLL